MSDPDLTEPLRESNRLVAAAKRGEALREKLKLLRQDVVFRRRSSAEGAQDGSSYDSGYHNAMIWANNELDALLKEPADGG